MEGKWNYSFITSVGPPPAVIDDFKDVQRARADQERLINEAQAYANRIFQKQKVKPQKWRKCRSL